jgi:hypothetical protein
MPRQKGAKAGVAPREVEDTIIREEPLVLTLEDRTALRTFFASAAFRKALHNARLSRPPVTAPGLDSALGGIVANNRLHQMQGWQMFEAALGRQVEDPKAPAPKAPDDYGRER